MAEAVEKSSIVIKHKIIFFCFTFVFIFSTVLFAHESDKKVEESKKPSNEIQVGILGAINENYLKTVKPIFQKSCFDCHSSQTQFPWYHSLPFVKRLLDSDVQEAKKHLDLSHDFPFEGHGTPQEDLEAIGKSIRKGTMPPFRYRMMHWGSGVSKSDQDAILKWVEESQKRLILNK